MSNDEWVVTMPKLGETVTEGELTNWLKQVGDAVAFDDPLFEVSTDKVDSEIPSPYDGVIAEILVASGETVPVGTPLVRIAPPGGAAGGNGGSAENRLPSTSHKLAAAGGPALGDPAAPQMGGSEGPSDEDGHLSAPTGVVHDITMPKLGETVTEGTIGSWLKQAGDTVEFDDPLFEVSTDKVDSEIPSPYDGVLLEILVQAGATVPVGTPLARIGEAGGAAPAATGSTPVSAPAPATGSSNASSNGSGNGTGNGTVPAARTGGVLLFPLVRRLVAENGLDVGAINGTGVGGRIRREDVEQAVASGGARAGATALATAPGPRPRPAPRPSPLRRQRVHRSPSRFRPAPTTRVTRSSRCPGCDSRWPAE